MKRIYGQSHLHFITFSCYRRMALLGSPDSRDVFAKLLDQVRGRFGFALVGYVVMPEHVHLLAGEPAAHSPSVALQMLKQETSRRMRMRDEVAESLPQFWERRFYDFNVWSQRKKLEKLDYMHMNPVKRGLVSDPQEWPWSSFLFYTRGEHGRIRIDLV
ncbi:MAG TPA: transposase [Candidatus Sulfotelmatobacter sp.]|nr:transposase [Candidatus Sulfotelmatobacter sp.]